MGKVFFVCVSAVAGSIVLVACVGDPAPVQGALDGPCFNNGTCNAGLQCVTVGNVAKCAQPDGSSGNDAAVTDASQSDTGQDDAGLPICTIAATKWPTACPGGSTGAACFGATQDCSVTGCSDNTAEKWECFGPNQCTGAPCCVSAANGALTPQKNCLQGTLSMTANTLTGAVCGSGAACVADDAGPAIQLCQFNYQCPSGQICSPVKVANSAPASIRGAVLGACMPP